MPIQIGLINHIFTTCLNTRNMQAKLKLFFFHLFVKVKWTAIEVIRFEENYLITGWFCLLFVFECCRFFCGFFLFQQNYCFFFLKKTHKLKERENEKQHDVISIVCKCYWNYIRIVYCSLVNMYVTYTNGILNNSSYIRT